jgi:dTDP-4-dehydrorhamnose reductase
MKILVTGSHGMMGWGIRKSFSNDELMMTNKLTLDITDIKPVMNWSQYKPDIIFHLAAETDHHRAELQPEHTYMVNHTGTLNMVELARSLNIPIVYIGTCGIFDGSKKSYDENDTPLPLNHYGRSKYYGELAVKSYEKHYIVRCGWSMGGGFKIDKKFLGLINKQALEGNKEIYAIEDVYGSPTYTPDFAEALSKIIFTEKYGTYNCAGKKASRYDMAVEFFRGKDVRVIPLSYTEYHHRFGLKVPYTKCEVLDTEKINSMGIYMRPWQEALAEYRRECF